MDLGQVLLTVLILTHLIPQLNTQLTDEQQLILKQCVDILPKNSGHQCWLQAGWGKCSKDWMLSGLYCARSCQYCLVFGDCICTDIPPVENFCPQLAQQGYCPQLQSLGQSYCEYSCGRCNCPIPPPPFPQPPPPIPSPPSPFPPPPPSPVPPLQSDQQQSLFVQRSSLFQQFYEDQSELAIISDQVFQGFEQVGFPPPFSPPPAIQSAAGQELITEILLISNLGNLNPTVAAVDSEVPSKCFTDLIEELNCCSKMLSAIRTINLDIFLDKLDDASNHTIFVPTDKAFENALDFGINATYLETLEPPDLLHNLVGYHIVEGAYTVNQLRQQPSWRTYQNGWPLFIDNSIDQRVLVRGSLGLEAKIEESDLRACNSMVQIISEVLIPVQLIPAQDPLDPTAIPNITTSEYTPVQQQLEEPISSCRDAKFTELQSTIAGFGQISSFWEWLNTTGLIAEIDFIAQQIPITLFFPTNEAVLQYQPFLSGLQQQEFETLKEILRSHIIGGVPLQLGNIIQEQNVSTLAQNQILTIAPGDPLPKVTGDVVSNVIEADVLVACNVILHVIDAMQVVGTYFEKLVESPEEEECVVVRTAFEAIQLVPELAYVLEFMENQRQAWYSQQTGNLTIFIPQQDRIQQIALLANSLQSSISSEVEIIKDLLEYHVIPNRTLNTSEIRNKSVLDNLIGYKLYPQGGGDGTVLVGQQDDSVVILDRGGQKSCNIAIHVIDDVLLPVQFGERYNSDATPDNQDLGVARSTAGAIDSNEFCDEPFRLLLDKSGVQECMLRMLSILQDSSVMGNVEQLTLLAPTDSACRTLTQQPYFQNNGQVESQILQYHFIPNELLTDDYFRNTNSSTPITLPTLTDYPLIINKQLGNVFIEDVQGVRARIQQPNIQVSCNFIVHVVDYLLIPFQSIPGPLSPIPYYLPQPSSPITYSLEIPIPSPTPSPTPCGLDCCSTYDVIRYEQDLSLFSSMIQLSNATRILQNQFDLTVLAPQDIRIFQFLQSFNYDSVESIPVDILQRLVSYHILEGVWLTKLMYDQLILKTSLQLEQGVNAEVLMFSNSDQLLPDQRVWLAIGMLNNVTLVRSDLQACGAVVHIVDYPLLIPGL